MRRFLQTIAIVLIWTITSSSAREYVVYNIGIEIPMSDEVIPKKNFYINMGSNQGLREGVVVDVFRVVSRIDPYKTKKRFNYKVKIGELEILHSEDDSAIASMSSLKNTDKDALYFEVDGIMIGDHVAVKIDQ